MLKIEHTQTHRPTHPQTDHVAKTTFLDSGDLKTCISIKISTSNFWHETNTFSLYISYIGYEKVKIWCDWSHSTQLSLTFGNRKLCTVLVTPDFLCRDIFSFRQYGTFEFDFCILNYLFIYILLPWEPFLLSFSYEVQE